MSRQAIAAVLARTDLASGERLVALSLASFAGRENRAWPGAPAASARAGLSRSRYQQAREQLVTRGLLAVDERATGRGRASTVTLVFADTGPWWDGDINVELFDAVLTYSRTRGPERLLLATMAAVADEEGGVHDLSTEQLRDAAGIADRTYRRARTALLASGLVELVNGVGGRGNTNVWTVRDPRETGDAVCSAYPRRVAPPAGARPLIASAVSPALRPRFTSGSTDGRKGRSRSDTYRWKQSDPDRGFRERAVTIGQFRGEVSCRDRGFGAKGGQDQTLFELRRRNPGGNPGENPGRNPGTQRARGKGTPEPQNQGRPPQPPWRGERAGLDRRRGDLRHALAAVSAVDRSGSTSTRSVEASALPASPIATTGSGSESASASSSARARSRSGSIRSS